MAGSILRMSCLSIRTFRALTVPPWLQRSSFYHKPCQDSLKGSNLVRRNINTTPAAYHWLDTREPDHEKKAKALTVHQGKLFDELALKARDKKMFDAALATYIERHGVYRRGHVEFIYAALERMKEFGVNRNLDTYKQVLEIFPKGKMIPTSMWQTEMFHYPKQQQCCIDILEQMENNGVIPDDEMGHQLVQIFGTKVHAFRKYRRMMYWMPKFKYANPFYVPYELPNSDTELSVMALKRMATDLQNQVSVLQTSEMDFTEEDTFIVSSQSQEQRELLAKHPVDKPVFVEGGFMTWLRYKSLMYFVLRADTTDKYHEHEAKQKIQGEEEDMKILFDFYDVEQIYQKPEQELGIHQQQEGTILGMCITGTASKDSLATWIKHLEKSNPVLSQIPVVFSLRTPEAGIVAIRDTDDMKPELAVPEQN